MTTIQTDAYTLRTITARQLQSMFDAVGAINEVAAETGVFDQYDAVRLYYDVTNIVRAQADTMPRHNHDRDPAGMYWGSTGASVLVPISADPTRIAEELHSTASVLRGRGKPAGNF